MSRRRRRSRIAFAASVIARSDSDEAIHLPCCDMDCFASLAMTLIGLNTRSPSRGAMRPEFCWKPCPHREQRAQGRPGARRTRGLMGNMMHVVRPRAYRFGGNTPAFPAQWLYSLYVVVLVTGFLATIVTRIAPRNLTPAPGRRTRTTSPYATDALVSRTIASTATCPNVCDDGRRPSGGTGWRES
jgi:hypothetical protein